MDHLSTIRKIAKQMLADDPRNGRAAVLLGSVTLAEKDYCDLLTKADSYLSLLRHRHVRWDQVGDTVMHEVDQVIGRCRQESEKLRKRIEENGSPDDRVEYVGLEIKHTDGRTTRCPWRFASEADLRRAFFEAEGEDPSIDSYEVVLPDADHPVWRVQP